MTNLSIDSYYKKRTN